MGWIWLTIPAPSRQKCNAMPGGSGVHWRPATRDQLEGELERDAGHRAGQGAVPAQGGLPMDMAAQDPLDRGMALDQFRQTPDSEAAQLVHEADADLVGRMVHQQDGRPAGRLGQPVGQPVQATVAQRPGTSPGTRVSSAMIRTGR